MKKREFICTEEPAAEITEREHAEFLLLFQKAALASLRQRKLLDDLQYERCTAELERRHGRKKRQAGIKT